MLRFKVDENLPKEVAALLNAHGHDALTVREQGLVGTSDADISAVCMTEGRVIVTLDMGFSSIRVYAPDDHPGPIRSPGRAHIGSHRASGEAAPGARIAVRRTHFEVPLAPVAPAR